MDAGSLTSWPGIVGEPRFDAYVKRCHGDTTRAARLYAWNIELTAAFWSPVGVLEVAVRNAIHSSLAGLGQDDWWNNSAIFLCDSEVDIIAKIYDDLREGRVPRPTPGQVVGASQFSLWTRLLGPGIARDRDYETRLWQPHLRNAFPHRGMVGRKELWGDLQSVRKFRNRLAHHEPIYDRPVRQINDTIRRVGGYIHPDIPVLIDECSRVTSTIARFGDALDGDSKF